jgi:hypothetical protein
MRFPTRAAAAAAILLTTVTLSAAAQHGGPSVMADLINQVAQTEKKIVDLAKAMPEATYSWRAGKARTTAEVLQHVAADNYLLPGMAGAPVPSGIPIQTDDYKTVQAYETRKATRDEAIADLERSFAHLKDAMGKVTSTKLGESVSAFGMTFGGQQFWIMATSHLSEHLGQLIAYARANDIVPPWSR